MHDEVNVNQRHLEEVKDGQVNQEAAIEGEREHPDQPDNEAENLAADQAEWDAGLVDDVSNHEEEDDDNDNENPLLAEAEVNPLLEEAQA